MRETPIVAGIVHYLRTIGAYVIRVNSGALPMSYATKDGDFRKRIVRLAEKGTPDVVFCLLGRFCAVEVKRDEAECKRWSRASGTREVAQREAMQRIRDAGGLTFLTHSTEDLDRDLAESGLIKANF